MRTKNMPKNPHKSRSFRKNLNRRSRLAARLIGSPARLAALAIVAAFVGLTFYPTSSASSRLMKAAAKPASSASATAPGRFAASQFDSQSASDSVVRVVELKASRRGHTTTEMADGRLLVAGGENQKGMVKKAELLDPVTGAVSLSAKMKTPRRNHIAVLLGDGRVLLAGGRGANGLLDSTEIFDPATESFKRGPAMKQAREGHSAVALANGVILIIGGDSEGTAEIFDPVTELFASAGVHMTAARAFHSSVLLQSGKVLVAGGIGPDGAALKSAEVFDLQTKRFSPTRSPMQAARSRFIMHLLPDGKVQVIGGDKDRSMEMFDPAGEYFSAFVRLPADLAPQTLRTRTRAAIINAAGGADEAKAGALPGSIAEMLNRSEHSLVEISGASLAVAAGGKDSNDSPLQSAIILRNSLATVTTARVKISPGANVPLTGAGFRPGEIVQLSFRKGAAPESEVLITEVADENGGFFSKGFVLNKNASDGFLVTATGKFSAVTAQTAFVAAAPEPGVQNVDIVGLCELPAGTTEGLCGGASSSNCITGQNGNFPDKPLHICNKACIAVTFNYSTDPGTISAEVRLAGNGNAQVGSATATGLPSGENQTACIIVCIDTDPNQNLNVQAEVFNGSASKSAAGGNLISTDGTCQSGPEITCPGNLTADTDANQCSASVTFNVTATGTPTPTVTCKRTDTNETITSPYTFPIGTTTVMCTAANSQGSDNCTFTVTVSDKQKPTLNNCPTSFSQSTTTGQCTATVNYTPPTATDNCGSATVVCLPAPGTFQKGTTTVTCTATDSAQNTQTCSFTVTVNDTEKPTLNNCPTSFSQSTTTGQCTATVNYTPPTASDNCGSASVVCQPAPGTFQKGSTIVTCTATDSSQNTQTCSFTVTVNDTQGPTFNNCPSNQTATATNCNGAVVNYTPPTATDNCDGARQVTCDPAPGSTFPIGTTNVNCTASDTSGNQSTCSFQVMVNGNAPTFTNCQGNITASTASNSCSASVPFTATASSGTVTCRVGQTVITSPGTFPLGTTTVVCTADNGACTSTCTFTVTVNDTVKPNITCPSNQTATAPPGSNTATVNFGSGSANDNCSGAITPTCTPPSGSPFPIGNTTVTCMAADQAGNSNSCTFTVTVSGSGNGPSFTACPPGSTVVSTDTGLCSTSVAFNVAATGNPTPTVVCKIGQTVITSPHVFQKGTTSVVCTATNIIDSATCSFDITVNDNQKPTITCPSNMTVTAQPGANTAVVTFTPTAGDNCAVQSIVCNPPSGSAFPIGNTTVTCMATDTSGNMSDPSNCPGFVVTVQQPGTPPPTFDICLEDESNGSVLLINTVTGAYTFCCGTGFTLSGVGHVSITGNIIVFEHTPLDRCIVAKIDKSQRVGFASLHAPMGTVRCTIRDRDITNNTCICR